MRRFECKKALRSSVFTLCSHTLVRGGSAACQVRRDTFRGKRKSALFSLVSLSLILLLCIAITPAAFALDPEPPKGCGPLPDLTKEGKPGVLITADRINEYRNVLPPEIANLVQQGELQFEAGLRPRDAQRFGPIMPATAGSYALGSSGELRLVPDTGLAAQPFIVPSSVEGDLKIFAYKILWNSAGALAELRSFAMRMSVLVFQRPDAEPHTLEFLDERIYPLGLGLASGTQKALFREKISAAQPEVIRNLSWLTLRFFGPFEDYIWAASPVINKIRQMTGSNRSDALFSQAFSPDDLFVWSGKIEAVEPVSVNAQPLLVPFLQAQGGAGEVRGECVVHNFRDTAGVMLNAESKRFKGAGTWVPSNVVMALRNTWKVELVSKDPFSIDSRQSVYFDMESGLPVYRIVWDQSGRLQKVVGGIFRSAQLSLDKGAALWAGEFIVHTNQTSRVDIIARELTACKGTGPGRSLEEFDPSSFMKFENKDQAVATKEKSLEQAKESDDISD